MDYTFNETTIRTLIRPLARGDSENLERAVLAMSKGQNFRTSYADEDMYPYQRLLLAWRYGLPPYHRNPARREITETRIREQRLAGCYVELVMTEASARESGAPPEIRGMILEEGDETWTVQVRQESQGAGKSVLLPLKVQADRIRICKVTVNPAQLKAFPQYKDEHEYLGLPKWFRDNEEAGCCSGKEK